MPSDRTVWEVSGDDIFDDTKMRDRAVQYGADTALIMTTRIFRPAADFASSEGGTLTTRPVFQNFVRAEFYQCNAAPPRE